MKALLLTVLILLTGTPLAHASDGALITVFWDRNTNGARDEGEPGYRNAEIAIRDDSGYSAIVNANDEGTYRLPRKGNWKISHEEAKFATTTPTSVESNGEDVEFGVRGAEVCGTVWRDHDQDVKLGDADPRVEGHRISVVGNPELSTTSAADGTYCLHDLPVGRIRLQSQDRAPVDGMAWSYADFSNTAVEFSSKFDWHTGQTREIVIDRPGVAITGYDSGITEPRGPSADAGPVTIDEIDYDGVRVGDTLIIRCEYRKSGNVPDTIGATLTLPEGLEVKRAFGHRDSKTGIEDQVVVEGQKVVVRSNVRVMRDGNSEIIVHADVRHAFVAQDMVCEAHPSIYVAQPREPWRFEIAAANADGSGPSSSAPFWQTALVVALVTGAVLLVVRHRKRA
ncbi:hypothetical protein ACFWNN_09615 [Lentzea sp. NPDC058450]|uniref:hypothetical protein n=1 Tax=Lentzea sp. NPDC058450 TaxID=3346505 RepID=UPI003659214E